ncbi:MAG: hypothetical protein ACK56I_05950, partial [bacterium]
PSYRLEIEVEGVSLKQIHFWQQSHFSFSDALQCLPLFCCGHQRLLNYDVKEFGKDSLWVKTVVLGTPVVHCFVWW